jgi:biopolymer transport protein ExbD
MRPEVDDGYDPFDESDDLAPLLDLKFILLIALIVVLMHFAQRDLDNRFAVPAGPGSPLIAVDEQEYQRMLVVSLDAEGLLRVNGQEVFAEQLAERLQAALPTAETDDRGPFPGGLQCRSSRALRGRPACLPAAVAGWFHRFERIPGGTR